MHQCYAFCDITSWSTQVDGMISRLYISVHQPDFRYQAVIQGKILDFLGHYLNLIEGWSKSSVADAIQSLKLDRNSYFKIFNIFIKIWKCQCNMTITYVDNNLKSVFLIFFFISLFSLCRMSHYVIWHMDKMKLHVIIMHDNCSKFGAICMF